MKFLHFHSIKIGNQVSLIDKNFPTLALTGTDVFHLALFDEFADGVCRKSADYFGAFLDCKHFYFVGGITDDFAISSGSLS